MLNKKSFFVISLIATCALGAILIFTARDYVSDTASADGAPTNSIQQFLRDDSSYLPSERCDVLAEADECTIDPGELRNWVEINNPTVIDGRPSTEYGDNHVPLSLNFELRTLKTKQFLKPKNLLLLSRGHVRSEVETTCVSLRKQGFHGVRIMLGGLQNWVDAGLEVSGASAPTNRWRVVSVSDFIVEITHRPWLIIELGNDLEEVESLLGQPAVKVSYTPDPSSLLMAIKREIESAKKNDRRIFSAVVTGSEYSQPEKINELDQLLITANLPDTYVVDGGILNLSRYLDTNKKIKDHLIARQERMKCG